MESCTVCTGRNSGSKQQGGHGTCSAPIECCMDFGSKPSQQALHAWACLSRLALVPGCSTWTFQIPTTQSSYPTAA